MTTNSKVILQNIGLGLLLLAINKAVVENKQPVLREIKPIAQKLRPDVIITLISVDNARQEAVENGLMVMKGYHFQLTEKGMATFLSQEVR